MRRILIALVVMTLSSLAVHAQMTGRRAWQQRLQVEVPPPRHHVQVEATNPFNLMVDLPAQLMASTPPQRVEVAGVAKVAIYVDSKGHCRGVVPLKLPFSGVTAKFVSELAKLRFEPAQSGAVARPSWVVMEVTLAARARESTVVDQIIQLPDPVSPPVPAVPTRMAVSANLVNLPVAEGELSSTATPRRLRLRLPAREVEVPVRALVRVSAQGRPDRFVPLELDTGLEPWFAAYLNSWQLKPAELDGKPTESWMVYTARVRVELSGLESTTHRLLRDESYDPRVDG